ncbi:MAG: CPBP family intramembrane metalloprotease [Ferruginibacter sp.]|nr:CPBP family intramembrane metalloprotease [Chitinophagaceae bacterium]
MIGILVQLAVSWLIVWVYEKGNLGCLGLMPTKKRLLDLTLFFLITAACAASGFFLKMIIAKQSWLLNPDINAGLILKGVWFTIKSVLFEELIFRGVLLYILIKKIGATWAIVISATAFGIYHWFSHELWGNPGQMAIEFFITGIMGVVLAYGYAKSFSLYIPIGIHLGWNLMQMVVFSGNTIGHQLLVESLPAPVVTISYFSYFTMLFLPLLSCWIINLWLLRRYKQVQLPGAR